jgi:hypothetical protein
MPKSDTNPIPQAWKDAVCSVLRSHGEVIVRDRARDEWIAATGSVFRYELCNALLDALSAPEIMGRLRVMDEPGETYEFFFSYAKKPMYGKICLCPDGRVIIIYSAHPPERPEL